MTHKDIRILLEEWQVKLRLQDWRIRLRFVDLDNDYGSCECNVEDKTAIIKILNFKDKLWKESPEVTHERVLVHEILHIHFWELHEGDTSHPNMVKVEQVINFLSDALVPLN